MEVSGQLHDPTALHPGGKLRYILDRREGYPHRRNESGWRWQEFRPLPGIEHRSSGL